ncbi:MAG: type II toxin-antitoxin system VapC family toxin [Bryobacteraceae bacterium]
MVTPETTRILVDTNILLRSIQHENPLCTVARKALKTLHRQNCQLCLNPQNVREFWNVCTRPTDRNGLGISVPGAERHTRFLERYFTVLPDSALTYSKWRQLVAAHNVLGAKVHDAWLVAAMKSHGASRILTFNTGDFARYGGIDPVDPMSV